MKKTTTKEPLGATPREPAEKITPYGRFDKELLITPKHMDVLSNLCWSLCELEEISSEGHSPQSTLKILGSVFCDLLEEITDRNKAVRERSAE